MNERIRSMGAMGGACKHNYFSKFGLRHGDPPTEPYPLQLRQILFVINLNQI